MPASASSAPPLSRGIVVIVFTVFAMALADAVVKYSSAGMTLWQIWVLRSLFVIPILAVMARRRVWPVGLRWVLIRSVILALMYLGIYGAIPLLELSVIAAALYTGPLFIVVLSAIVLGERVGAMHWLAILIGFAGVLLIVRPLAEGFSILTLLPIGAALLYALAAVLTRAKCAEIPATAMALWLNLTFLGLGGVASIVTGIAPGTEPVYPFLFGPWQPMRVEDWLVIGVLAALMIVIGIGLARAYQSPRPQVIATFDYAYLIFAGFWGYVFFGEVPDVWTVAGMLLIVAAGLVVLLGHGPQTRQATAP
ncbi:MAG: DMT family transporter [Paracoccaceae bacterium]